MERVKGNGEQSADGIVDLFKETADGFGQLIADHLKLIRVELRTDIKAYGRPLVILGALMPVVLLGYALVCLGLSVLLARWLGLNGALFLVGGVHLVGAGGAALMALRKLQTLHLFRESSHAASESMSSLTASITNGREPTVASPDSTPMSATQIMARVGRGSHIVASQR